MSRRTVRSSSQTLLPDLQRSPKSGTGLHHLLDLAIHLVGQGDCGPANLMARRAPRIARTQKPRDLFDGETELQSAAD